MKKFIKTKHMIFLRPGDELEVVFIDFDLNRMSQEANIVYGQTHAAVSAGGSTIELDFSPKR